MGKDKKTKPGRGGGGGGSGGSGGGRGHSGRGSGGKLFIDNEDELEIRNREFQEKRDARAKRRGEEGEDEEGESGSEGEAGGQHEKGEPQSVFSFGKVKADLPLAGDEEDEEEGQPLKGGISTGAGDPPGMNRREREALAAQKAKEDYMKRHLAGETDQAKADLARLAQVRARREAAAKKREEEGRPPGWTAQGVESSDGDDSDEDEDEKPKKPAAAPAPAPAPLSAAAAKKKAAAAGEDEPATAADGGPPKLKAMDIKKMNADALKEHLKARGLDIQGQKKDLMKRLTDYEAARP